MNAANLLQVKAANSRIFGIVEDGEVVSSAQLFSDGSTAQVEDVATLPAYRGRGTRRRS
jgi:predicted GNAT family acetyltransferase